MTRDDVKLLTSIVRGVYRGLVDFMLKQPGKMTVKLLREDGNMLVLQASLPVPAVADVVKAVLNNTIIADDGSETDLGSIDYLPTDTVSQELKYTDNQRFRLTLTHVDDAGNVSEPRVYEGVAVDTIAPPQPGEFGVTLLREE